MKIENPNYFGGKFFEIFIIYKPVVMWGPTQNLGPSGSAIEYKHPDRQAK